MNFIAFASLLATAAHACDPGEWGVSANIAVEDNKACLNVSVPADFTDPTPLKLGRFFPESASFCFACVTQGDPAPEPCKVARKFDGTCETRAGEVVDAYIFTDTASFAAFTVGETKDTVTPMKLETM